MNDHAVGVAGHGSGHLGAERTGPDGRWRKRHRRGHEDRRHQIEPVEVGEVIERCAVGPVRPDRLCRLHDVDHAADRPVPGRGVPAFDVRLDLGPEPESEAATGGPLEIPALVRQVHRRAGERNGHVRVEVEADVRSSHQREEGVAVSLEREAAVDTCGPQRRCMVGRGREVATEAHVDLHGRRR